MTEDGGVAGAGFEPDIKDVSFLLEFCSATTGTLGPGRNESISCRGVPSIGSGAREELHDGIIDFRIVQRFAAAFTEKDGDGHTPDALSRDAPVRTGGNHVGDAFFAPCRVPLHLLDLFQSKAAKSAAFHGSLHRDEPLLGGAEDDRIVAAPAVGIRVLQALSVEENATNLQQLDDGLVRVEDLLAIVFRQAIVDHAGRVHLAGGIEFVPGAGVKIFCTMGGSGVDDTSTGVHGHVVGQHP